MHPISVWAPLERVLFRFAFPFFMLYVCVFNNGAYSFFYTVFEYLMGAMHVITPWVAGHILHLPQRITIFTNGSGDTTYDYVSLLIIFVLAILVALIWSIAGRKSKSYPRLYYWLTVALRYYVGLMLINYGFYKVFKSQFSSPGFYRLNETYGESSPMGLAWTFLGFSEGYNYFMGFAELMGALLLFRRTLAIGAFLSLMTCANVMAVNYFYDIPVKIVSTSLVVMCLVLLLPYMRPLWQLFFQAKTVQLPSVHPPLSKKKWLRWTLTAVKSLMIFFVVASSVNGAYEVMKQYGEHAKKPLLYGSYDVELISPPKIPAADSVLWKRVAIDGESAISVRLRNDEVKFYGLQVIPKKESTFYVSEQNRAVIFDGKYAQRKNGDLEITGTLDGQNATMLLHMKRKADYTLTGRGFHWISEYPYNR
ncbi:MAG: hypothetical protein INR69_13185 [Mucilaginibacter polytrichastri]|nr:hypothetical protein [Mucilaginibacter polytrichastri]